MTGRRSASWMRGDVCAGSVASAAPRESVPRMKRIERMGGRAEIRDHLWSSVTICVETDRMRAHQWRRGHRYGKDFYGWYLLRRARRGELERQGVVAD